MFSFCLYQVQAQGTCKAPYVEQRLLYDDVKYASPFYVIALPRTPQTVEMDNVCYTYFEKENGMFFHVMSITYKNGTNTYYDFSKGDIANRMGIAEAKSGDCVYHDYTLKPICNVTVFILYRCYIEGACSQNIDVGALPGVDVRVTLAASPKVSPECQAETQSSLRDTSALAGGDYILLPQKLTPNCVTKYNDLVSIGDKRALGPKAVTTNDLTDRFAEPAASPQPVAPTQSQNNFRQGVPPPSAFNPYGRPSGSAPYPAAGSAAGGYGQNYNFANSYAYATKTGGNYGRPEPSPAPVGLTPTMMWTNGPVSPVGRPGAETHYHIWQSAASTAALKAITDQNPNVYYHIHSWAPPQGCCKCV